MASDWQAEGLGRGLPIGKELRSSLGLSEGESLRVLHTGPRTLLLERHGDEATALPWDRDLVLCAEVRAFPIADVLGMLHDAGKSGFLFFADAGVEKSVFVSRGEVVFASSNQTVDRIGECLLRAGAIDLDQLREAERSFTPPVRFGKVLVERGFLTPRELWNGVKNQVEEIVRSLFSHTDGTLLFWEGSVQPDNVVRLSLPTRRLVAEGLAKRDELLRFVAGLEDPRVRLAAGDTPIGPDRSSNERRLVGALAHEHVFSAVCRVAGLDPLSAARSLELLCLVGAVRIDRDQPVAMDPLAMGDDEGLLREHVLNHVKLLAELSAPLVALEGAEAVGQRLERVVEDAATRFPELLRDLPLAGGIPDPDLLSERALRLASDRERAVSQALGELVAYMEFELKNSPHIEEPDRFLDAVEGLREAIEL